MENDNNPQNNTEQKESKFSRLKTTKLLKKEKPQMTTNTEQNKEQEGKPVVPQGLSNKDKANFERLLKQKEKEIEGLKTKVTEYNSKESRANLESECKSIFEEVGINEAAYKDVLDLVCNNFTLTNGKLLNAKGQKGDVATFLREYTKEREYLLNQKKGSGLKSHSSATKLKSTSGSSFEEYKEARASKRK